MRNLALYTAKFILKLSLLFGLILLGMSFVFGSSESIKQALREANAYSQVVDASINTAKVQSPELASVTLANPEIERIVRKNISGEVLQNQSEAVIDSIYAWLDGTSENPNLVVDIAPQKQAIADDVGLYAAERLRGLPVCTRPPATSDVLAVTCRQPNLNPETVRSTVRDVLLEDQQFLPDTKLDLDTLSSARGEQSINDRFANAPMYFRLFKIAPYVLLGVFAVIASMFLLFVRPRIKALTTIGWILVSSGAVLLITPLAFQFFMPSIQTANTSTNIDITPVITGVFRQLSENLARHYYAFGGVSVSLGLVILIATYIYKKRSVSSNHLGVSTSKIIGA